MRKLGSTALAVSPIIESSKGTSRHPSTRRPSEKAIFSMPLADASAASGSFGRKAMPMA